MGQVEMTIQCDNETIAIEISEKINEGKELKEFIAENTEGDFDFYINGVSGCDEFIYVQLSSNRTKHIVQMAEMIKGFLVERYEDSIETIDAEIMTPENFLSWEKGDK